MKLVKLMYIRYYKILPFSNEHDVFSSGFTTRQNILLLVKILLSARVDSWNGITLNTNINNNKYKF